MNTLIQRYIDASSWAILPEYLELMAAISLRDEAATDEIFHAIERRFGAPLEGTRGAYVRDGVGIISVSGPMFRYANLFSMISGATSYERLAADLGTMVEDPAVERIVIDMNSPGGEVDGASETAQLIRSMAGEKDITAFVSHYAASGGLWLASAANRVIVADTAIVGSVGVVATLRNSAGRKGEEQMEIVSSQTPRKRPNPFSEDAEAAERGRSDIQARVDSMAEVFIRAVASYRDMDPKQVTATEGAVYIGQEAVEVGFADGVGTLEGLIQSLTKREGASGSFPISLTASGGGNSQEDSMDITRDKLEESAPELVAAIRTEGENEGMQTGMELGAEQERERIMAILALPAQGFEQLQRELAADPTVSAGDAALRILDAKGKQEERRRQAALDELTADEKTVGEVKTLPVGEEDSSEAQEEAVAARIAAGASSWAASIPG